MKRALVFSDSHGDMYYLMQVLSRHKDVDAIFHAGDIQGEDEFLRNATPKQVCIVRGNCDWSSDLPENMIVPFGGRKIALCHGHRAVGFPRHDFLRQFGRENDASIVISGHTHVPVWEPASDVSLLNPGSITEPRQESRERTYAYLEVDGDEVHAWIRRAEDDKVLFGC